MVVAILVVDIAADIVTVAVVVVVAADMACDIVDNLHCVSKKFPP